MIMQKISGRVDFTSISTNGDYKSLEHLMSIKKTMLEGIVNDFLKVIKAISEYIKRINK